MAPEVIRNKKGYSLEVDIWSLGCTIIEMGTGRHPWHQYADVAAMFKIAYSKDVPEIPECFSKEGKDFLSLCLKRDPAQRPSATQLLGHPFLQDHQELRASKCNINQLRNRPSFPIVSSKGFTSKRVIAPLLDIEGQSARDFTGFSTAHPSPCKASSTRIDPRKNMSLPVSPCSSPLRQFKQSNWSCLPSPSHPEFSSSGSTNYNAVSYKHNQMTRNTAVNDPWHDIGYRP
ncbi:hypothetical protein QOZ80_2BG0189490 [Eleusine coracana subsp. coracana]|nr:hypothetical protein QOZ80_2BG0189490 [Eleusine coracana subsp. coracana]